MGSVKSCHDATPWATRCCAKRDGAVRIRHHRVLRANSASLCMYCDDFSFLRSVEWFVSVPGVAGKPATTDLCARLDFFGADGTVEKFDDVHNFLFAFDALNAGAELQEASGGG